MLFYQQQIGKQIMTLVSLNQDLIEYLIEVRVSFFIKQWCNFSV